MSTVSGLDWPPDDPKDLAGPPEADDLSATWHRLSDHPVTWRFATQLDGGGGRFDLPAPEGTCHVAESLEGALLEKVLRVPKKIVSLERLQQLFHATIDVRRSPRIADLTQPLTRLGLNAELHTTLDYAKPRAWAAAVRRAGWQGLRYLLRGDNALRERGVALFGRAGVRRRSPAGLHTRVAMLDADAATALLERRGVSVLPIPAYDDLPRHERDAG